jgi:hypothetical protein
MVVTQKIIHPVRARIFGPKMAKKIREKKKEVDFFFRKA